MKKVKDGFKSLFKDKIFNKEWLKDNIGIVIIGILVFVVLVALLVYFLGTKNISKIEENKLKEQSSDLIDYIDDLTQGKKKDDDKYIIYALDYSYNVNSTKEMSVEEISSFINSRFTKKMSAEEVKKIGVTPKMIENNIVFDNVKDSYKINDLKKTAEAIAKDKIVYYKLKKIRKINKKKYTMTYTKYVIEDPYKILDFYIEKNRVNEGEKQEDGTMVYDLVDVTILKNYLMGSAKVGDVKKFIRANENDVEKYAKKSGKLKVTFEHNGENLLIKKIK